MMFLMLLFACMSYVFNHITSSFLKNTQYNSIIKPYNLLSYVYSCSFAMYLYFILHHFCWLFLCFKPKIFFLALQSQPIIFSLKKCLIGTFIASKDDFTPLYLLCFNKNINFSSLAVSSNLLWMPSYCPASKSTTYYSLQFPCVVLG